MYNEIIKAHHKLIQAKFHNNKQEFEEAVENIREIVKEKENVKE